MSSFQRITRLASRVTQRGALAGHSLRGGARPSRLLNKPFRTSKRTGFWTGEEHGFVTPVGGRPPVYYAYLFSMTWPLRIAIIFVAAVQADIVEHTYYGYPPEDWYYTRPKIWRKREKVPLWARPVRQPIQRFFFGDSWRPDCDIMDLWCWKGVDPKDFHH